MNFCVNCNHYSPHEYYPIPPDCHHPQNLKRSPVSGENVLIIRSARLMRETGPCGAEGTLFKEKVKKERRPFWASLWHGIAHDWK